MRPTRSTPLRGEDDVLLQRSSPSERIFAKRAVIPANAGTQWNRFWDRFQRKVSPVWNLTRLSIPLTSLQMRIFTHLQRFSPSEGRGGTRIQPPGPLTDSG